jgi:hypothetical protein
MTVRIRKEESHDERVWRVERVLFLISAVMLSPIPVKQTKLSMLRGDSRRDSTILASVTRRSTRPLQSPGKLDMEEQRDVARP